MAVPLLAASLSCSDFYMPTNATSFRLSVRTMDLGDNGGWNLTTGPKGTLRAQDVTPPVGTALSWKSKHGFIGFSAPTLGFPVAGAIGESMNQKGLSCGALALTPSKMPPPSATKPNLHMKYLCMWAVEQFDTVAQVKAALATQVQLWGHGYLDKDCESAAIMSLQPSRFDPSPQLRSGKSIDLKAAGL